MSHFFDAACLVQFDYKEGAHIIKYYPSDFDFSGQESILSICSFPEVRQTSPTKTNDKASIEIFASSIATQNSFVLSFLYYNNQTHKREPNSLVIITHKTIASEVFRIILDARILLLRLLKEEKQIFKQSYDISPHPQKSVPEILLDEVWKGIRSSTFDYETGTFFVTTPIRRYPKLLTQKHVTYAQFDPLFWLGQETNIFTIWRALLTNREILIVGESATHVSCAIFSILSLIAPLKYSELYIPYTRLGDPRVKEITNEKSKKWKLVGTTNQFIAEQTTQFSVIGYLPPLLERKLREIDPDEIEKKLYSDFGQNPSISSSTNQSFSSSTDVSTSQISLLARNMQSFEKGSSDIDNPKLIPFLNIYTNAKGLSTLRKATKQILKHIEFKLNEKLNTDPYFDLLDKQLEETDFYGLFIASKPKGNQEKNSKSSQPYTEQLLNQMNKKKNNPRIRYFTTRDAMKFQSTATFRNWRAKILYRTAFRESFLSQNPEDILPKLTQEELIKIRDLLANEISEKFASDMHMRAVIKKYLHAIKKFLK